MGMKSSNRRAESRNRAPQDKYGKKGLYHQGTPIAIDENGSASATKAAD